MIVFRQKVTLYPLSGPYKQALLSLFHLAKIVFPHNSVFRCKKCRFMILMTLISVATMPKGQTKFNPDWLATKDEHGDLMSDYFVASEDDQYHAVCTACNKTIKVSIQGKGALLQHSRGPSHKSKADIKYGRSSQQRLAFRNLDQGMTYTV